MIKKPEPQPPFPPEIIVTFEPWGVLRLDGGCTQWPEREVEELAATLPREFLHTQTTPATLRTIQYTINRWVDNLIRSDKLRYNMFESRWEAVIPIEEVWDRRETD